MILQELYEHYGTWTRLTRSLDLCSGIYYVWRDKGYIPFKSQLLIEHKTKGLFKADEAHAGPSKKKIIS